MKLCKAPSEDVRLAAYRLFETLAATGWGIEKMLLQPNFVAFLEDTVIESSKIAKELKHAIAKRMLDCPNLRSLCGPADYKLIHSFVQRGPFLTGRGAEEAAPEVG